MSANWTSFCSWRHHEHDHGREYGISWWKYNSGCLHCYMLARNGVNNWISNFLWLCFYAWFRQNIIIVVYLTEQLVYWSLIANGGSHNIDDQLSSRDIWTARYWRSWITTINIANHYCPITIISQIKPSGSLKTRTTHIIEFMKQVPLSSWGLIELGNKWVCREIICDIANSSVNISPSGQCYIPDCAYTGWDAWKQHRDDLKNTVEQSSNVIVQGNLDLIFFEFVCTIN
jgi:hypothetical protein